MESLRHPLEKDFPECQALIHKLKTANPEFASKAKEYDELDHQLCGLERCSVPTTDEHYETLKLRRVKLKDELYGMIRP